MFKLDKAIVNLGNVNAKPELRGEDHVTATYLKVEYKTSNTILDMFDSNLLPAFFRRAADGAQETLVDGHLPELKFPLLSEIGYGWEGAGYVAIVQYGISGGDDRALSDIFLPNCGLDKFSFEMLDGGTVNVSFRIVAHPDALGIGRLTEMQKQEITLTLEPPSADVQLRDDLKKYEKVEE